MRDELPQLFNVLMGHMSMVGPRPEREVFVSKFRESVVGYDLRYSVKPGITGLAQVSGNYSTSVERKLRYDLLYIYNYSLVLDFRILIRTFLVLFHREQAEGVKEQPANSSVHEQWASDAQVGAKPDQDVQAPMLAEEAAGTD